MIQDCWKKLDLDSNYYEVWDKFEKLFGFKPSVSEFPGIKEPQGSITFDLKHYYLEMNDIALEHELEKEINRCVLGAFKKIVPSNERMLALDWQHPSFYVDISKLDIEEYNKLTVDEDGVLYTRPDHGGPVNCYIIPVLPDGDYSIFLTQNFKNGTFGHPWEPSICVFGSELITEIKKNTPKLLSKILRENGAPPLAGGDN